MSLPTQFSAVFNSYLPAVLKNHKSGWYIEYYVLNPITRTLERKLVRMNALRSRCRTANEFKVQANSMVCQLNIKLAQGWSPFAEMTSETPGCIPLVDLFDRYIHDVEKDLRPDTLRSYNSFGRMLKDWCNVKFEGILIKDFNDVLAVRYLDEQREARDWKNSTYNNNLVSAQAFFTWCVKKKYISKNPFFGIEKKKKEHKTRTLVVSNARAIVREYFMKEKPEFLLVCELVFNALLRPMEISRIKVGQVDLANKVIHLSGDITKTHYDRDAVLSDELIEILRKNIEGVDPNWYLVGKGYKPGKVAISTKMYRKTWAKMREKTGLPETMQLYSLRDTGIVGLFDNGADANTVKGAADHHNLNITSIYCDHVDEKLVEKVREYTPTF